MAGDACFANGLLRKSLHRPIGRRNRLPHHSKSGTRWDKRFRLSNDFFSILLTRATAKGEKAGEAGDEHGE
jgi:hypothetical protein